MKLLLSLFFFSFFYFSKYRNFSGGNSSLTLSMLPQNTAVINYSTRQSNKISHPWLAKSSLFYFVLVKVKVGNDGATRKKFPLQKLCGKKLKPRLHIHDFLYDSPRFTPFLMVRKIGMDRDESWRKVETFSVTTIPVRISTILVRCL